MANGYNGNAMPAPGFYQGAGEGSTVEILYSMAGYKQKGVTLKPGQGVLAAGTALAYDSASGQYIKTTTAGDVKGFLRATVDTDSQGGVWLGNILYAGSLKLGPLLSANSGLTADALETALKGRADKIAGFFKF